MQKNSGSWRPFIPCHHLSENSEHQDCCPCSELGCCRWVGFSLFLCRQDTVICLRGAVPKHHNKKMTQSQVENLIRANGGWVKKSVPDALKGCSTKRYIILFERLKNKKVPFLVKAGLARSYKIVHVSSFVWLCWFSGKENSWSLLCGFGWLCQMYFYANAIASTTFCENKKLFVKH